MGFSMARISMAILLSGISTTDAALEFLIKDPQGWAHPFIPSEADPFVCQGCGELRQEHVGNDTNPGEMPDLFLDFERQASQRKSFVEADAPETLCEICYIEHSPGDIVTLPCLHAFC